MCGVGQTEPTECGQEGEGHSEYQAGTTDCARAEPTKCGRGVPIEETNKENTEEIYDHESGTDKPEVCGMAEP